MNKLERAQAKLSGALYLGISEQEFLAFSTYLPGISKETLLLWKQPLLMEDEGGSLLFTMAKSS
jgi:cytochrome c-type biogenesis protein CcmH/NrfF